MQTQLRTISALTLAIGLAACNSDKTDNTDNTDNSASLQMANDAKGVIARLINDGGMVEQIFIASEAQAERLEAQLQDDDLSAFADLMIDLGIWIETEALEYDKNKNKEEIVFTPKNVTADVLNLRSQRSNYTGDLNLSSGGLLIISNLKNTSGDHWVELNAQIRLPDNLTQLLLIEVDSLNVVNQDASFELDMKQSKLKLAANFNQLDSDEVNIGNSLLKADTANLTLAGNHMRVSDLELELDELRIKEQIDGFTDRCATFEDFFKDLDNYNQVVSQIDLDNSDSSCQTLNGSGSLRFNSELELASGERIQYRSNSGLTLNNLAYENTLIHTSEHHGHNYNNNETQVDLELNERFVAKSGNDELIVTLKGKLEIKESYEYSYPNCWSTWENSCGSQDSLIHQPQLTTEDSLDLNLAATISLNNQTFDLKANNEGNDWVTLSRAYGDTLVELRFLNEQIEQAEDIYIIGHFYENNSKTGNLISEWVSHGQGRYEEHYVAEINGQRVVVHSFQYEEYSW